tara:strand:+ start:159 stop:347 length:189 start_codon:yes stop_codon:yes gene_type:complete
MSQEDTMYEIYNKVRELKITKSFDKQLSKMESQDKHRWKTMSELWEYALNKVILGEENHEKV